MNIAFIVSEFPCLSETFIMNQITGLIDRGHEVDIYAYSRGDNLMVHGDIETYNLLEQTFYYGDPLHRIPENKCVRLIKAIGLIAIHCFRNPMPLLKSLNVFRFGKEAASLRILYKIIPFVDRRKYDVVCCHFGYNGNLGVLLRDVGAIEGKVITAFHGYDLSMYVKKNGKDVYDYLFRRGDLFLPISERWKDELIKLGCSEEKIVVHRMGIDTSKCHCSPRKRSGGGTVQLLTIARFVRKKGIQYGILAVAQVLKQYPNIEYKIVGDGPLKEDLESLAKQLNISDDVKFLGWKRQEELIELMKGADILLAPSVTTEKGDQEGIPVVLMEALTQGVPVISTYHSGIPELVQDGESGFLVAERDVNALADRLAYLIDHSELRATMGQAGRKYVAEHYDINTLNDRLLEICRKLANG